METKVLTLLIGIAGFLLTMVILRFTPNDKIKAMAQFFKAFLPKGL